ncbi:hypothetical protein J3R30DRAFT_1773231 [Lentinula aciculospora]|uniref:DASH complex subunit DUO1 n=1 Tax=Lentinula aciculospora TaxID=153920 RepID=A0A9W9AK80_9AGAR|nr:hypothetical protein J3R30DRAFT_1773231 [Lentinula aciculospora]
MDFSSNFSLDATGSRLLSESPIQPSTLSSQADLSISELSLSDRPSPSSSRPFSLLARPASPSTPIRTRPYSPEEDDNQDLDNEEGEITQKQITVDDGQVTAEEREEATRTKAKLREDKLQNDLHVLRKLNTAFSSFNEALEGVGDANERISRQLSQTEGLLNKYMAILAKSEEFSRLIFDEDWDGVEQDEMILRREAEERIERERKEAEERALAQQRERELLEREAKERQEREKKERIERERKDHVSRGGSGVRGVRGTRASTRAATNNSRGHTTGPSRVLPPSRLGRGMVRRG